MGICSENARSAGMYESTFVLSYFRKKEMENIFFVFIALYMMRSVTFRKGDTRTA